MNLLIALGQWADANGIDLNKASINFDGFIRADEAEQMEKEWGMEPGLICSDAITITLWHGDHKRDQFQQIKRVCGGFVIGDGTETTLQTDWHLLPGQEDKGPGSMRVFHFQWLGAYECETHQTCVFKGFKEERKEPDEG